MANSTIPTSNLRRPPSSGHALLGGRRRKNLLWSLSSWSCLNGCSEALCGLAVQRRHPNDEEDAAVFYAEHFGAGRSSVQR